MRAVLVGRVSAPFCVGQCDASLARNWTAAASATGSNGATPPVPSAGHPSQSAMSMFSGRLSSSRGARDLTITVCHAQVLLKGLPS